jgi:hypothetical protein
MPTAPYGSWASPVSSALVASGGSYAVHRGTVLFSNFGDQRLYRQDPDAEPAWSPDGVLHFISDSSGWWNLYLAGDGRAEPVAIRSL